MNELCEFVLCELAVFRALLQQVLDSRVTRSSSTSPTGRGRNSASMAWPSMVRVSPDWREVPAVALMSFAVSAFSLLAVSIVMDTDTEQN